MQGAASEESSTLMLDQWVEAKRQRDFATADRLRASLEARGLRPEVLRPHVWEAPGASRERGTHRAVGSAWPEAGGPGKGAGRGVPLAGRGGVAVRGGEEPGFMPPGIDKAVG